MARIGGYGIPGIVVFFFWVVVVLIIISLLSKLVHWGGGGLMDVRLGHFSLHAGFN